MAALSAIKMQGEFRDYFERKVAEGKNKMTVINAVRAKIFNRNLWGNCLSDYFTPLFFYIKSISFTF
jgi:hypothetical protein